MVTPKITKIEAFHVDLPLREGSYKWSGGNSVRVFDSTIVAVSTDAELQDMARSAHSAQPTCQLTPRAHGLASRRSPHT